MPVPYPLRVDYHGGVVYAAAGGGGGSGGGEWGAGRGAIALSRLRSRQPHFVTDRETSFPQKVVDKTHHVVPGQCLPTRGRLRATRKELGELERTREKETKFRALYVGVPVDTRTHRKERGQMCVLGDFEALEHLSQLFIPAETTLFPSR